MINSRVYNFLYLKYDSTFKSIKSKTVGAAPRTAMEVYELLPETAHAEVIDNLLYMPPTPSFEHQDTSADLVSTIRSFCKKNNLGKCVAAPISVYLDSESVVEPDIVFIKMELLNIIQKGKIKGVPDLFIELLSPRNRKHDLVTKRELYQHFAVPEYIIIDPITKEAWHYVLENNAYKQLPVEKGIFHSQMLQSSFSF
jgi:Uma2 family endonuclease